MSDKPKIMLSVLCQAERTGWINPFLFDSLMALQLDGRFSLLNVMAYGIDRVEVARNRCVQYARDTGAEHLVMIDNDQTLPPNFGGILHEVITSGKAIVGFPYARVMSKDWTIEMLTLAGGGYKGDFQQVGCIGSGVLILSSEVWRRIPRGPWFTWQVNDDEVLSQKLGEDYSFCELARQHGLIVWGHTSFAGHLKTCDATKQAKQGEGHE